MAPVTQSAGMAAPCGAVAEPSQLEHAFPLDSATGGQHASYNALPCAIIEIDARTRIITAFSARAEALFGYTRHEALGMNVNVLIPEALRTKHDEVVAKALASSMQSAACPACPTRSPACSKLMGGGKVAATHKDGSALQLFVAVAFDEMHPWRCVATIMESSSLLAKLALPTSK